MVAALGSEGFRVYAQDPQVMQWAEAAAQAMRAVRPDPAQLRHGKTWYVGLDALPNALDGSVGGVALRGPWEGAIEAPLAWHRAQVSIVYPGYPQKDPDEGDAAHRYRIIRFAAHVDGLLPIGAQKRRFLREPHAFILGLPLNACAAAPLMVWPGSHLVMQRALRAGLAGPDPTQIDITEVYHAARRAVFEEITPVAVQMEPGQAVLLHRQILHGVAPWGDAAAEGGNCRSVAYFRPEYSAGSRAWRDNS